MGQEIIIYIKLFTQLVTWKYANTLYELFVDSDVISNLECQI